MANIINRVEGMELHAQAALRAREHIDSFAESLLFQSKTLAAMENAEVVLSTHVDDAHDIVIRRQKKGWGRELLLIAGSAMFGTFLQGFFPELTAGRQTMVVIYMLMGIIGMVVVFIGLHR